MQPILVIALKNKLIKTKTEFYYIDFCIILY